jgi:hypothetical protein
MKFILLTYVNRSGSTFLANLLDSSPKILACPEGDLLVSLFLEQPGGEFVFNDKVRCKLIEVFSENSKLKYWGEAQSFLRGLESMKNNIEAFKKILINYRDQVKPGAEFILFKAERIVYLVRKIRKIETGNEINFISIIRDPRAVYASQQKTVVPETNEIMAIDPIRTSLFWKDHVRRSILEAIHKRVHLVSYETMVNNWLETIHQISEIINVDLSGMSPGGGKLYSRLPEKHRNIHSFCAKPPETGKINEWENILTRNEILIIEYLASRKMNKLGYEKKYNKLNLKVFILTLPGVVGFYSRKILQKFYFRLKIQTV